MLEERKVQKAKITLMRDPKFALWSGILMVGRTSVVDNLPTACTNGRDEKYGRKFVASLKEPELNFVVLHENLHKAFRHLITWKKLHDENHRLANAACDYVINLKLKDIDPSERVIAMPRFQDGEMKGKPMGLVDERFRGMHAKQVFDILKQEQKDKGEQGEGNPCDDGDPSDQEGGTSQGRGAGEGFDDHDWDGAKEMTEAEKKDLEREIDQAIRQGVMAHQKIAGVVDVGVVTLCRIGIACQYVRETIHPCNHLGLDTFTNRPLNPLLGIGFANSYGHQSVTAMCFEGVAYPIGREITRQKHYGIVGKRDVTQTRVCLLKHGVKHILYWVSTFRELIEHDDQWLLLMDFES